MEFRTDLNISEEQFMNLYGWYSWPSIFLGFIGGYLLDNIFGLRFGTALAGLFVVIGQVFLSMGKASEILSILILFQSIRISKTAHLGRVRIPTVKLKIPGKLF